MSFRTPPDAELWCKLPSDLWPAIKSFLLRPSNPAILTVPCVIIHPVNLADGTIYEEPHALMRDATDNTQIIYTAWPIKNQYITPNIVDPAYDIFAPPINDFFICYREYTNVVVCDIYNSAICYKYKTCPRTNAATRTKLLTKLNTIHCTVVLTKDVFKGGLHANIRNTKTNTWALGCSAIRWSLGVP